MTSKRTIVYIILPLVAVVIIIILYLITPRNNNISLKNSTHNSPILSQSVLNLSKLTALKNYTFSFTHNSLTITGLVYSSQNWSTQQPVPLYHINGYIYTDLANIWYRQKEGSNNYSNSPYINSAKQFIGFRNVTGVILQEGKSCSVSGITGHLWMFKRTDIGNSLLELASSCISNKGYMLSENIGTKIKQKYTNSFTITSIGSVKPYTPPASFKKN